MMMQNKVIGNSAITDFDGNIYTPVVIGSQTWLSTNLKTTHFNNGDFILNAFDASSWIAQTSGARCHYQGVDGNINVYGYLYNGYAINDVRGICPVGYHIPTKAEVDTLIAFLGATSGGKLKEVGTAHWQSPNTGAIDAFGFTSLPGGWRTSGGAYEYLFQYGFFWTSTLSTTYYLAQTAYNLDTTLVYKNNIYNNNYGMSIRCIKD